MKGAHLVVQGLSKRYGGIVALDGVTFQVEPGELVGLIGPNGSGKSTAIDCIAGIQAADEGAVSVDGESVLGRAPHSVLRTGLVRTFQATRVFSTLSVLGNVRAAQVGRLQGPSRVSRLLRRSGNPAAENRARDMISDLGVDHISLLPAGNASYGQRKLIEFATAMVEPPLALLLDEPVAAVNPTVANIMKEWMLRVRALGTSILLVEHNIELVTDICDRIVVLDRGRVIADGMPTTVMADETVQEAYFGR